MIDTRSIDKLNDLLREEITAAETYMQAIAKIDDLDLREEFDKIQASHAERAQQLRLRILELGGKPVEGSGFKGKIMSMSENIASTFSSKAAVGVLEEEEDNTLKDYRKDLDRLDDQSRSLVMHCFPSRREPTLA